MADLLEDIEIYLRANNVASNVAIFKDTMLPQPVAAVGIYEYAGLSGPAQVASALRSIQIVSRAPKVKDAKAKAKEIYTLFVTEDGILNITPERWSMIHLRQPPFKFKVDTEGNAYYAFNMGVTTYTD